MGNPNKNQHLPPTSHRNQSLAIVHVLVCRAKYKFFRILNSVIHTLGDTQYSLLIHLEIRHSSIYTLKTSVSAFHMMGR